MKVTSFAVGIPTLNRFDLLQPFLIPYTEMMPDVRFYIIDNGVQGIKQYVKEKELKNIDVITPDYNYGVAKSWNLLCDLIFDKHTHALILNDDIYLGKTEQQLLTLIKKKPEVFLQCIMGWCCFLIPNVLYKRIGAFNEAFYPAYYEDDDYVYRMKLNGLFPIRTPELNPVVYRNSETIQKNPSLIEFSIKNKAKYVEIWGGLPREEKFTKPYNK